MSREIRNAIVVEWSCGDVKSHKLREDAASDIVHCMYVPVMDRYGFIDLPL